MSAPAELAAILATTLGLPAPPHLTLPDPTSATLITLAALALTLLGLITAHLIITNHSTKDEGTTSM
jgi:hypothetical protein